MESSIAVPLFQNGFLIGLLVLNSKQQSFYNREKVLFLESICRLSSGLLFNLDFINPKDSNISLQDDEQFFITVDNEGRLSSISDNAGNIFSNRMIGQKAIDYLRDKIKTEDAIDFSDALLKNHSAFSCVCLSSSEEIFNKCKQIEMEIIPLIDKYNQDLGKIVFFRPLRTLKEDK